MAPSERGGYMLAALRDVVLIAGGVDGSTDLLMDEILELNLTTQTVITLAHRLAQGAVEHGAACAVRDRVALFAGGEPHTTIVDIYDSDTGNWTTQNLFGPARRLLCASSAGPWGFFVAGSEASFATYQAVDLFNADNMSFVRNVSLLGFTVESVWSPPACAGFGDEWFFVFDDQDQPHVLNVRTMQWSRAPALSNIEGSFRVASTPAALVVAGGSIWSRVSGKRQPSITYLDGMAMYFWTGSAWTVWEGTMPSGVARSGIGVASVGVWALMLMGSGDQWSPESVVDCIDTLTNNSCVPVVPYPPGGVARRFSAQSVGSTATFAVFGPLFDSRPSTVTTAHIDVWRLLPYPSTAPQPASAAATATATAAAATAAATTTAAPPVAAVSSSGGALDTQPLITTALLPDAQTTRAVGLTMPVRTLATAPSASATATATRATAARATQRVSSSSGGAGGGVPLFVWLVLGAVLLAFLIIALAILGWVVVRRRGAGDDDFVVTAVGVGPADVDLMIPSMIAPAASAAMSACHDIRGPARAGGAASSSESSDAAIDADTAIYASLSTWEAAEGT